jgi:ADP-heptose:LPS heptosyltransferase
MGLGDVLMSIGEAKRLHKKTGQKVMIIARDGRPVRSDLFNDIPYIIHKPSNAGGPFQRLFNSSGVRPYIAGKTAEKWAWKKYKPIPADIVFTKSELEFADRYRGRVMIEPEINANAGHQNKAWIGPRWRELVQVLNAEGIATVQCVPGGVKPITDTAALTPSFRYACAVLSVSRAFIGTEGGLMHAAAAVGVPGVILWSHFITPEVTGYDLHRNIRHAEGWCGMRVHCEECAKSMERITVTEVVTNLKEILK